MQLNRDGRLAKWAYLWADWGIPEHTNLCTLFWRTVLWTPLKVLVVFVGIPGFLGLCIYGMLANGAWKITLIVLGIIGCAIPVILLGTKASRLEVVTSFREGAKGLKQRYCPRIKFVKEKDQ